jgi:hypothetical protein
LSLAAVQAGDQQPAVDVQDFREGLVRRLTWGQRPADHRARSPPDELV